jgi:hypothetical protein
MLGGFQPDAFQPNAYQNTTVQPNQFGYAVVVALSQTGLQGAQSAYIEGSAALVTATFYDIHGVQFVPSNLRYSVDDIVSGAIIVPWTEIAALTTSTVIVTSAQQMLVSLTREFEQHQVVFEITDGFGNIDFARVIFLIYRIPPPAVWPID